MDKRLINARIWMVLLRRICLLLCAVVTITVIVLNMEDITADNIRRIMAKLDVTFEVSAPLSGYISYPENKDNVYAMYKGGLAVLAPERLRIFDAAGIGFLDKSTGFSAPYISSSKRFVLAYDRGGTQLFVYNSFACVFSETYDGNILSARINDAGFLSVLTHAAGYNALLTVYDSSFREIYKRWYSEGRFAVTCDVSADGKRAFAVVLKASLEGFDSYLEILSLGEETPVTQVDTSGQFPFKGQFITNNRILIAGDQSCRFYDDKGELLAETELEGRLTGISAENGKVAVGCMSNQGRQFVLRLLDADGKEILKHQLEGDIKSVCAGEDYAAALTEKTLYIAFKEGFVREIPKTRKEKAVFAAGKHILLVSDTQAEYIPLDE